MNSPPPADFLFERFLDNLSLYFETNTKYRQDLADLYRAGKDKPEEVLWEQRDTVDTLRIITQRCLDEYILNGAGRLTTTTRTGYNADI